MLTIWAYQLMSVRPADATIDQVHLAHQVTVETDSKTQLTCSSVKFKVKLCLFIDVGNQ